MFTFLIGVAYGGTVVLDLYFNPVYNSYPVLYDFDYGKTIRWELS